MQIHLRLCSFFLKLPRYSSAAIPSPGVTRRFLISAVIALLALTGTFTRAAQNPDLTQKSIEDLMNIDVTSVSKKEQKTSQAPAAVFVISQEDIRHSGALNIPDLLRMVPGLDVAQIDAGKWAISARGFNGQYSNKLLVLIDGRTAYTPLFAGVFWDSQNVALDTIERIEVIRGPGAAVWGSNAVNGVISIITKTAANTQGGCVTSSAGNASIGPETIRFGGKVRNLAAYRVHAEGFRDSALPTLLGPDGKDGWHLVQGGFRTDTKLSAKDNFTAEGEAYQGNAGEIVHAPVSLLPPENATVALKDHYSGWNLLTRWDRTLSLRSETSLQGYFDRTSRGDSTYGLGLNTFNIDFQHHVAAGAHQDFVWGLGYRASSDRTSPTMRILFTPQNRFTQLFSSFAQDEIVILPDRVHLSLGARLEHNDYTGFGFQPSARVVWTPDSKNMAWGAVSRADRTPARSDTNLRVNYAALAAPGSPPILVSLFGNPNQKNERLTAFEAGFRNSWSSRFSLDSTVFYDRYRDLASVEPEAVRFETDPAPVHVLIPSAFGNGLYGETKGIEVFANWKAGRLWTLSPGYGFLSMHLRTLTGSQDTTSVSGTEGGTPDHQAQLRSTVSLPWNLQWNASAFFVNRLPAQSIPAYTRLDTGLTWRAGERLTMSLAGRNLLRDLHPEYNGPNSTVQSGLVRRDAYAKIEWSF